MSPIDLTRREFLAGAGALAVTHLLPQSQPPAAPANPRATASLPATKPPTLWVNGTTGSDSNTYAQVAAGRGSVAWRTISRAAKGCAPGGTPNAAEAAKQGDVVDIAAGTYSGVATNTKNNPVYNPVNEGSAGNPITFQANGTVNLTWADSTPGPMIGSLARDYITWTGFTIAEPVVNWAADTGPVTLFECSYCTIDRCHITSLGMVGDDNHPGIRIEGSRDGPYVSQGCVVSNCTIHNFYQVGNQSNATNGCGIQVYTAATYVIEHNEIYDCPCALNLKHGTVNQGILRYNFIHDIDLVGIRYAPVNTGQTEPTVAYQNLFVNVGTAGGLSAIQIGSNGPKHFHVVNNTIVRSGWGIYVVNLPAGASDLIWNNIIADSAGVALYCSTPVGSLTTDLDCEHNCYHGSAGNDIYAEGSKTLATWKSTYSQDSASPASFTTDPGFTNPGGGIYTLGAGSPCLNAGIDVLNLLGGGTSQRINQGCYITGTETIGRR